MTRLTDDLLDRFEGFADEAERQKFLGAIIAPRLLRAALTEIREHRELLSKIGVASASMNVDTTGFFRFEMPWAFKDGEERLSVAEIIRRTLAGTTGDNRATRPASCPCTYVTPCHKRCTCINAFSSSGCHRCCTYGSLEQRTSAAHRLADMHRTAELADEERRALQAAQREIAGLIATPPHDVEAWRAKAAATLDKLLTAHGGGGES